jgi:hypothetical protein
MEKSDKGWASEEVLGRSLFILRIHSLVTWENALN